MTTFKAAHGLHHLMLRGLSFAPMSFFDRQPVGRILNRFVADMASIDATIPQVLSDVTTQVRRV